MRKSFWMVPLVGLFLLIAACAGMPLKSEKGVDAVFLDENAAVVIPEDLAAAPVIPEACNAAGQMAAAVAGPVSPTGEGLVAPELLAELDQAVDSVLEADGEDSTAAREAAVAAAMDEVVLQVPDAPDVIPEQEQVLFEPDDVPPVVPEAPVAVPAQAEEKETVSNFGPGKPAPSAAVVPEVQPDIPKDPLEPAPPPEQELQQPPAPQPSVKSLTVPESEPLRPAPVLLEPDPALKSEPKLERQPKLESKPVPQPQPAVQSVSVPAVPQPAAANAPDAAEDPVPTGEYTLGVDDILEVNILQPEALANLSIVGPDGNISVTYIGSVRAKGRTVTQVQQEIQTRLADGYMKYPVVAVSLKESRSRKFFVYGEVLKPGSFPMEENMTVLRAISMAGGFTRFGSSSRVKVLRPRADNPGYETLKVNIKAVMDGIPDEDTVLRQGDIVVVSEGVF